MNIRGTAKGVAALVPLFFVIFTPLGAAADDIADLKKALQQLQQQNRDLSRRVEAMEAEKARAAREAKARAAAAKSPPPKPTVRTGKLEQRVRELEAGQAARDAATRRIIRSSLSKIGPQVNETAALSGSVEVEFGRSKGFGEASENTIGLNTVELELDLRANDWVSGSVIVAYEPGTDVSFAASDGSSREIDRFTADRAALMIGNTQRFPLYAMLGRDTLPFGTSTGLARTSSLSVADPLTIEAFETRANGVGIGFAFPTPPAKPAPPPVVVPEVKPLVLGPAVEKFAGLLGYKPPPIQPEPPAPVSLPTEPPPFYGSIHIYDGSSNIGSRADFTKNLVGSLGYRTSGHCGRPYSDLRGSFICPWRFDAHIDYNSSFYNSNFLRTGYDAFLNQIGIVPGIAASAKLTVGPFALTTEYNEAIKRASFVDDAGTNVRIRPAAWQVSLGYQFDWNPWVETIGDQGTLFAVGYSRSQDLAGVMQNIDGELTRVGTVAKSRLILTASEWVIPDLNVTVEGLIDWDYVASDGGTGKMGHGVFTSFTYNF